VAGPDRLVAAIEAAGAFVADTSPLLYRLEGRGPPKLEEACDRAFERVEAGSVTCLVSAVTVAEIFVGVYRLGEAEVAHTEAYVNQPGVAVVPVSHQIAQSAGWLVARRTLRRLADALIAATANDLGLPLLTADRELARSRAAETLLLADFT
jgi:predicted nucleic acid-binding protein